MIQSLTGCARLLSAAVLLAGTFALSPAIAAPAVILAQGQPAPVAVSEADLATFVTAAKSIVALRHQYEPRLAAAGSQAEADALLQEARGLMSTAIADAGISIDNYMAIANAAQTDPALRQRIEAAVGASR
ncbi:MAG: DUF4168 domain-containing protein [Proteobacteria bacterium]|nr:DUF4168 domain-containing protein [Pseudomonadota bacterium]